MSLTDATLFPPLVTSGIIGTTLTLTITNLMKDHPVIRRRIEFLYGFSLYPAYFFVISFFIASLYLFFNIISLLGLSYFLLITAMIFIFRMIVFMTGMSDPRLHVILGRGGSTEMLYSFWIDNPYSKP